MCSRRGRWSAWKRRRSRNRRSGFTAFWRCRNLQRCCIDQTGIGRQFAERAAQRFGRYKAEGIQFTSAVKEDLAYATRTAFEKKTVRIPADKLIRADLRSMRKEATASGNIRFTGSGPANGHADRFWALALALHAARQQTPPTGFLRKLYEL